MCSFPYLRTPVIPTDLARLQFEMEVARRVQFSLMPQEPPAMPGLEISTFFQPASYVGGDFFDFIVGPDQSLTFFIGDVSGKGVPAAMLMTMTRAILRAEAASPVVHTPEVILQKANEKLLADFVRAGMFVTVFAGQYHPVSKELVFANAGHSAVIFRPVKGKTRLLEADGPALGLQANHLSRDNRLRLFDGDLLVITTDGLYEACNSQSEYFGIDRLLRQVHKLNGRSALEILEILLGTVGQFSGCEPQADDLTVLVLRSSSHAK